MLHIDPPIQIIPRRTLQLIIDNDLGDIVDHIDLSPLLSMPCRRPTPVKWSTSQRILLRVLPQYDHLDLGDRYDKNFTGQVQTNIWPA
jgi:hypothetical protein